MPSHMLSSIWPEPITCTSGVGRPPPQQGLLRGGLLHGRAGSTGADGGVHAASAGGRPDADTSLRKLRRLIDRSMRIMELPPQDSDCEE